jgi:hypothetical protein
MNKNILDLILMCNLLLVIDSLAQQTGTLTIAATNFENAKGMQLSKTLPHIIS